MENKFLVINSDGSQGLLDIVETVDLGSNRVLSPSQARISGEKLIKDIPFDVGIKDDVDYILEIK